jgi:hypothetical protein
LNSTKSGSYTPEKSVVTPATPVADSRPAPSDLPGLRDWKSTRSSSSIIEARRAAQALAASRMAAKVAQDKLEARLAALAEDRRVDQEARKLLSHAHDQSGTLESALADFRDFDPSLLGEMGERVLNRAQDLDGEVATSAPRRRYRSSLNPYRRADY